jgi:hypothetical protein
MAANKPWNIAQKSGTPCVRLLFTKGPHGLPAGLRAIDPVSVAIRGMRQ